MDTLIDLALDAFIPKSYVTSEKLRIDIYKKIAELESEEDVSELIDELIDRFGDPSRSVTNLVAISMLRKRLTKLGVVKTVQNGESVYIYTDLKHLQPAEALCMFYKNNKLTFRSSAKPYFVLKTDKKNTLADLEIFADGFEEIIRKYEESQK